MQEQVESVASVEQIAPGESPSFEDANAEFRRFVEAAEDFAIFLMDAEGVITTWSAGAEHLFGYSPDEAKGSNFSLIFTPDAREKGQPETERNAAISEGRLHQEGWQQRRDGSRFWASGVLTAFKDEAGNLRGFSKIVRDMTEQHLQQEAARRTAEKDRRIAQTLQQAMLVPLKEDQFPGISVATLHEAAWEEAQVGGDFYDGFLLSDTLLALAVGDASGKGLTAAVRTTQVKDVLRALLRSWEDADAAEAMSRLNDYIFHSKRLDAEEEEHFVCLALALLETQTGEAIFVVAGAEPPLILRADGRVESVEKPGLPLGVFPAQPYEATRLRLEPGDALLLVTDGLTEARRGNTFLNFEGLAEIARSVIQKPSIPDAARELLNGAKAFAGNKLHDDACLLLARRHASLAK